MNVITAIESKVGWGWSVQSTLHAPLKMSGRNDCLVKLIHTNRNIKKEDLVKEVETGEEENLQEGFQWCQMLVHLSKKEHGPKEYGVCGSWSRQMEAEHTVHYFCCLTSPGFKSPFRVVEKTFGAWPCSAVKIRMTQAGQPPCCGLPELRRCLLDKVILSQESQLCECGCQQPPRSQTQPAVRGQMDRGGGNVSCPVEYRN